jgi:hypothetical protein
LNVIESGNQQTVLSRPNAFEELLRSGCEDNGRLQVRRIGDDGGKLHRQQRTGFEGVCLSRRRPVFVDLQQ